MFVPASFRTRATSLVVAAVGLIPGSLPAAIVFFDVVPDITIRKSLDEYVTFGDINLSTGTYTLDAYNVGLNISFVFSFNGSGQWRTIGNVLVADNGVLAANLFNYGDLISAAPLSSWRTDAYSENGPWASGGSGYLGVVTANSNFGWMALNYAAAGNDSTLTISGFAFESVPGQPILAGQGGPAPGPTAVPEPGTWAAAALLAGGAAFMHRRRRNQVLL